MSRYKSGSSLKIIDSKFPHHVDMMVPEGGFGTNLTLCTSGTTHAVLRPYVVRAGARTDAISFVGALLIWDWRCCSRKNLKDFSLFFAFFGFLARINGIGNPAPVVAVFNMAVACSRVARSDCGLNTARDANGTKPKLRNASILWAEKSSTRPFGSN